MEKELGRNDLCHCGSGKKYKNCHMNKPQGINNNKNLTYIGIFVLILAIAGFSMYLNSQSSPAVNRGSQKGGVSAPPPGEAPPGKVWSSEHGHWHDI